MNSLAKKFLFCVFFFLLATNVSAQQDSSMTYKRSVIRINVLIPGIASEIEVFKRFTIFNQFALVPSLHGSSDSPVQLRLTPKYYGEVRFYYNLFNRMNKGRDVSRFAANYFAFQGTAAFFPVNSPSLSGVTTYYLGLHYGLQRNIGKNWYFDINAGGGIAFGKYFTPGPSVGIQIGLGYCF